MMVSFFNLNLLLTSHFNSAVFFLLLCAYIINIIFNLWFLYRTLLYSILKQITESTSLLHGHTQITKLTMHRNEQVTACVTVELLLLPRSVHITWDYLGTRAPSPLFSDPKLNSVPTFIIYDGQGLKLSCFLPASPGMPPSLLGYAVPHSGNQSVDYYNSQCQWFSNSGTIFPPLRKVFGIRGDCVTVLKNGGYCLHIV